MKITKNEWIDIKELQQVFTYDEHNTKGIFKRKKEIKYGIHFYFKNGIDTIRVFCNEKKRDDVLISIMEKRK